MAHPYFHALSSRRKWGGTVDEYLPLHQYFDQTKSALADCRHRLFLHNPWGALLLNQQFSDAWVPEQHHGVTLDMISQQHITEDYSRLVSVEECVARMQVNLRRPPQTYFDRKVGDWSAFINFFSAPRQLFDDDRAYALVLNSYAPFLLEQLLGCAVDVPGAGIVQTRFVAERVILHACGEIPTLEKVVTHVPIESWMCRGAQALSKTLIQEEAHGE